MNFIYFLAILGLLAANLAAAAIPTEPDASNHPCTHLACFDPINHGLNHGITNSTLQPGKANLLLTNEEGWAEKRIRVFYEWLADYGHDVIISSPPFHNPSTNPRLNWVNAEPATGVKYGVEEIWPRFQGNGSVGGIDMVLVGPAVGANRAFEHRHSGTTGAAVYAAKKLGIPSIAFAGWNHKRRAWNRESDPSQEIYASMALNLTNRILANGKPYLPPNVLLNVNFPRIDKRHCSHLNFKYVLTAPMLSGILPQKDIPICRSKKLPAECVVVRRQTFDTCYVSISPMDAKSKGVAKLKEQREVLKALEGTLSCYPYQSEWKEFWTSVGCALRFWEWK
ncbi:survival protein sure-like phosphatase/nucleotidase [Phyllosticta capitalensis]